MNKNNLKIVSAILLSLGISSAYAGMNLPLGSGSINGSSNKQAVISLAPLTGQQVYYDINCDLTDKNGGNMPVIIKFEISGLDFVGMSPTITFDGASSTTSQAELADANTHRFTANLVSGVAVQQDSKAIITWLASDDMSSPTNYACSATPSVGRKK